MGAQTAFSRRQRWWLGAIVLAAFTIYATAALVRYDHLSSGVDLAIFSQAVWHYSQLQAPVSTIKGENILGDHFHPLVAVLAVLYRLWQDPRTLLLAQAALVAASVVPVFLFARTRLAVGTALALSGAYAAFWGLGVGVSYDFHELAFAPLLIGCALLAVDRDRLWLGWTAVVLLLLVKEDMSLVVSFIGVWLLTRRRYGHGAAMILVGAGFYELATRVLIPHFATGHDYGYWTYGQLGSSPLPALWALITGPWKLVTIGLSPVEKTDTLLALFAPFLFLSLGSPLILVAVPLLAERFLSANPNYWSTHFQYSMAIAPVLAMAAADAMPRLARAVDRLRRRLRRAQTPGDGREPAHHRRRALAGLAALALAANLGVSLLGTADSALALDTGARTDYLSGRALAAARGALAEIPAAASVAAPSNLAGHLADRRGLEPLTASGLARAHDVVVDVLDPSCCESSSAAVTVGHAIDPELAQFTPRYYRDGWLVAARPAHGPPGSGVLTPLRGVAAQQIRRDAEVWLRTGFARLLALQACARRQPSGGLGCFAAGQPALRARAQVLQSTITTAGETAVGGCRTLLAAAAAGVGALTGELAAVAQARSLAAVARAYGSFSTQNAAADDAGRLERFLILCEPRTRSGVTG